MKKLVMKIMKNYAVVILAKTDEGSVEQRLFIVKSCLDIELLTRLAIYMLDCSPVVLGEVDLHLKKNASFSFFSHPLPSMFVSLSFFIDPEEFTNEKIVKESVWYLLRVEDAQLLYEDWKMNPSYATGKKIIAERNLTKKEKSENEQEKKENDDVYYTNRVDNFAWMANKRWPGQFKLDTVKPLHLNKRKNS